MGFKLIEVSTWDRKEYFDHYLNKITCSYSITVNIDVTRLINEIKRAKIKFYPTMIYISSLSWVTFTSLNLNLPKVTDYLLPIFTMGKYFEQNGTLWMPLAIQVHHAVCDGFHVAKFINELQEAIKYLKI